MAQKSHRFLVYPRIGGHETVGVIVELRGPKVREGERVQVAPGLLRRRRQSMPAPSDSGGHRDGGFADLLAVPLQRGVIGQVTALAPHLSFEAATFAEPLACCIQA